MIYFRLNEYNHLLHLFQRELRSSCAVATIRSKPGNTIIQSGRRGVAEDSSVTSDQPFVSANHDDLRPQQSHNLDYGEDQHGEDWHTNNDGLIGSMSGTRLGLRRRMS